MSYGCKCKCENFREHAMGINIAPSAMPSRRQGADVAASNKAEQRMSKDHAAYKRMKAEGLQPKSVRGVAKVEAGADDVREITEGKLISKTKLRERDIVRDAIGEHGVGANAVR